MTMRIVHGASASPFVRKVRVALAEKGLDYELRPLLPFNVSAEYDKALNHDIPPLFDYLESQLQAREVIAGTRFSIGDIGICTHFVNMQHAGHEVNATRWPKLARYVAHVLARPSFKALIDEEAPLFRAA